MFIKLRNEIFNSNAIESVKFEIDGSIILCFANRTETFESGSAEAIALRKFFTPDKVLDLIINEAADYQQYVDRGGSLTFDEWEWRHLKRIELYRIGESVMAREAIVELEQELLIEP